VLYLTAVKETQEKLQLCQRYSKHHELCGKAADLPIAACSSKLSGYHFETCIAQQNCSLRKPDVL